MFNKVNFDYLVSICITSYNRIKELERCIKSVDSKYIDKIEIVVSEDNSPQREKIKLLVSNLEKILPYRIVFNTNVKNLGYDMNLQKLVSIARGEYIFFLSDDDALIPGALDKIIDYILKSKNKPKLLFEPFSFSESNNIRRKYSKSHIIPPGENSAIKYLYSSILFSGLIFHRNTIKDIKAERFSNLNYFQVYLFLTVIYKFGGCYLDILTVNCVSDGENAYGLVESSNYNELLADRKSVFSNLEFNKGLIQAIKYFDKDNETKVFQSFSKEYSFRTFGGLCRAKVLGNKIYKDYWLMLKSIIELKPIAYFYYVLIYIMGYKLSIRFYNVFKFIVLKMKGYVK